MRAIPDRLGLSAQFRLSNIASQKTRYLISGSKPAHGHRDLDLRTFGLVHLSRFWHNRRVGDDAPSPRSKNESVSELEQARREIERLQRELERVERERDRLRQQNERLKQQLDAARRAGFRQAAPFAKPLTAIRSGPGERRAAPTARKRTAGFRHASMKPMMRVCRRDVPSATAPSWKRASPASIKKSCQSPRSLSCDVDLPGWQPAGR
jgi:hypothetical protein